jgi:hypothetical protein
MVKKDNVPRPYITVSKLFVGTFREGRKNESSQTMKNETSQTKEERKFANEGRTKVWSNTAEAGERQAAYDAS